MLVQRPIQSRSAFAALVMLLLIIEPAHNACAGRAMLPATSQSDSTEDAEGGGTAEALAQLRRAAPIDQAQRAPVIAFRPRQSVADPPLDQVSRPSPCCHGFPLRC